MSEETRTMNVIEAIRALAAPRKDPAPCPTPVTYPDSDALYCGCGKCPSTGVAAAKDPT